MSADDSRVVHASSLEQFDDILTTRGPAGVALLFWADFEETGRDGGAIDSVFARLSTMFAPVSFVKVEADKLPSAAERFGVQVAPTTVFLHGDRVLAKVEGADPSALAKAANTELRPLLASNAASAPSEEAQNERLNRLVRAAHVMLFMKGSPQAPRCKFSRAMVDLLAGAGAQYGSFDILSDQGVRQGLKKFSNWPTYPQLYVGGKLLGGLDVVKELQEEGELADALGAPATVPAPPAPAASLDQRLREVTTASPAVLFMKGSPDAPRCGFSATMVQLLRDEGLPFTHFDVLSDEEVRQGLKKFSNWPTYPQLYVGGKLIGGLDVVKELQEEGELADLKPAE